MPIIQLQPKQIADFWDGIKRSLSMSVSINDEAYDRYMNKALERLLSGALACWLIFDYDTDFNKQIHAMIVTSIKEDLTFGYRTVWIEGLYGFRKLSDAQALDAIESLKTYARNTNCKYIRAITDSDRAKQIANLLGFYDFATAYTLEV